MLPTSGLFIPLYNKSIVQYIQDRGDEIPSPGVLIIICTIKASWGIQIYVPFQLQIGILVFIILGLCWWRDPGTVTRFSRTFALLSAASRGKVELIIEHYRVARCCRDQTQHPFTPPRLKKKRSHGGEPLDLVLLLQRHTSSLKGRGIKGWDEAAACSAALRSVLPHASPWLFKGEPCCRCLGCGTVVICLMRLMAPSITWWSRDSEQR